MKWSTLSSRYGYTFWKLSSFLLFKKEEEEGGGKRMMHGTEVSLVWFVRLIEFFFFFFFELIVSLTLRASRASSIFKICIKKQLKSNGCDELGFVC